MKKLTPLTDYVQNEMQKLGIQDMPKPKPDDEIVTLANPFPPNLTELSNNQLGILSSYYGAFWVFISNQLAIARINLLYAENAFDYYTKKATLEETQDYVVKRPLKSTIEAKVADDKNVVYWLKKKQVAEAEVIMLKSLADSYDRYYEVVNREIYRRINLVERGIE